MRQLLMLFPLLVLAGPAPAPARHAPALPLAAPNDNDTPAGRLHGDTLIVKLVASMARWQPEEDSGGALSVALFGEEGSTPSNPGPLIRVSQGTLIRATLRNALTSPLVLHGIHSRPSAGDTLMIAPGATREVSFTAGAPGTYFYWGTTTGAASVTGRRGVESQLNGAWIVDPANGRLSDKVMVLSIWADTLHLGAVSFPTEVATINGRSFGHRPWLDYTVGDSVRWRVINASDRPHPMHLHGFFFRVDSRGDADRDTTYSTSQQRLAVTERLFPGTTLRLGWSPNRSGDWIFHCHIVFHVTWVNHLPRSPADTVLPNGTMGMSGMVVGLHIHPRPTDRDPEAARTDTERVRLLVQQNPRFFNDSFAAMGYVVQHGAEPARDSVQTPGMPIVLTRGRPSLITVVNHLSEPTAVHWHGIELTSYYDGVAGISGSVQRRAPMIMPGDSFTAYILPSRAGSFMYHTHLDDIKQLFSGLTGPLIVLDSAETWDPATDHVVYFTLYHDDQSLDRALMNGFKKPPPLTVSAGVPQRFRFFALATAGMLDFRLVGADSSVATWSPVAKDGADLIPAQRLPRPAKVTMSVGETSDFIWTPPHSGVYRLQMLPTGMEMVVREMEVIAK